MDPAQKEKALKTSMISKARLKELLFRAYRKQHEIMLASFETEEALEVIADLSTRGLLKLIPATATALANSILDGAYTGQPCLVVGSIEPQGSVGDMNFVIETVTEALHPVIRSARTVSDRANERAVIEKIAAARRMIKRRKATS